MRHPLHIVAVTLALCAAARGQAPDQAGAMGAAERKRFEAVIKDYLLRNPELIRDAFQALQLKEQAAAAEKTAQALAADRAQLLDPGTSQYIGSASPDVTIVEFFDYHCGYCKQIAPVLQRLVDEDPKVRVVLKELPILGSESLYAAKVALASRSEGKYAAFHRALMSSPSLGVDAIKALARDVGIDAKALEKAESKEVEDLIRANSELAGRLQVNGTPGLVIGDRLLPGAVDYETLRKLVSEQRQKVVAQAR